MEPPFRVEVVNIRPNGLAHGVVMRDKLGPIYWILGPNLVNYGSHISRNPVDRLVVERLLVRHIAHLLILFLVVGLIPVVGVVNWHWHVVGRVGYRRSIVPSRLVVTASVVRGGLGEGR